MYSESPRQGRPEWIVSPDDRILITGANGFIGSRVVAALLRYGFVNLRCLTRSSRNESALEAVRAAAPRAQVDIVRGNLLSRDDCHRACEGVSLVYHLAAGRGEKSYPTAYLNSVVTTRNLLEVLREQTQLKRLVCVSSFTVYAAPTLRRGTLIDETCATEGEPHLRGEAYCYAKVRQEEIVREYAGRYGIPVVIARPGVVYGPGNPGIPGRVGVSSFGLFLHLGGASRIPLSYVENCADALVLAGLTPGVSGETFNVVDDDAPTSRHFLTLYKRHAYRFRSLTIPAPISYLLCYLWETYSRRSRGQLPPVFNRRKWAAYWNGYRYSNEKIKGRLGWRQPVPFADAARIYFESERRARLKA
jgi:nucleoside-diphosphate-sugar epimerase